jgi:polygalacturonase
MLFAYRVFADGYMLSDCKDAVVEYNFARTGDDAFETKSTSSSGLTERVLFQHNAAWTDKAVAYGCIYESNHDTRGVKFINNSVGFALGTWSPHLGCCVIQMGNRRGATIEDILFKNMEIYASYNNAILNVFIGGSGGIGEGWGTVNNIQFKNITATLNYGSVLNVQTRGSEDAYIKHLYLNNIVSNGERITSDNYNKDGRFKNYAANFNPDTFIHIDELDFESLDK